MAFEWRKVPEVWQSPTRRAAELIETIYAFGKKVDVATNEFVKRTLADAERQIVKHTERVPQTTKFSDAKPKLIGSELSAAIKEGAGSDVVSQSDGGGFRPQPTPTSQSDAVSRADGASEWTTKGAWKQIDNSRDVIAIRYEIATESLFIQFRENGGAGPIYEYGGVTLAEARSCYKSRNIDEWILDHLRERGTWHGHLKPYRFVSNPNGRTPRQAVSNYRGRRGEWFVSRTEWNVANPAPPMGADGQARETFRKHNGSSYKKGKTKR